MKKLLAAGLERIFQICKAFRNREEVSSQHNPEFTILEWYRASADYRAIMDDCEELLIELRGGTELRYRGERIDLARPWERLSVREAFRRHAGSRASTSASTAMGWCAPRGRAATRSSPTRAGSSSTTSCS